MSSRTRFRELLDEAPPHAEAVEYDGEWVSWGDLQLISAQLDSALTERGHGPGSRIGVILENRPEHVAVLLTLLATERCVVTHSGLMPPHRLSADVAACDLPVLVGSRAQLAGEGVLEAARDALVLELSLDGVTARPTKPREPRPSDLNDGVVIEMLTSGTTGPPKRVALSEVQFDTALGTSVPSPPQKQLFRSGVSVVCTPMVHIGGFWGALAPLYSGRRLVLMAKFDLEEWVTAIERHRPRAAGLVPASLRAVLAAAVPAERLSSLEVITSGTTFCPVEIIDAFLETYGIRVLPTYGATEFAGAVATWSRPLHETWWERKAGSAGRPMPGVELRITNGDGLELPARETGHLEIRTLQSPVGEGAWLRTSDLASLDEDGFLWINGRADDAIVRGGFKVHPDQIRAALEQHPAVREAAVAPLPDERLGAVPVAGIELNPGQRVTSEELRAFCRELLTPYEVPVYVAVLDDLPRTPSSKVSRQDLLELVTAEMERLSA